MKTLGLLPLGRATFDVPYAEQQLAGMLSRLDATDYKITGPRKLLFDSESTIEAMEQLQKQSPDIIIVLQVTFTDAAMVVEAANRFEMPLVIWAVPEPRLGGRLRLNAFCGLNLASHALGLTNRDFGYLYIAPDDEACSEQLLQTLGGNITHGAPLTGELAGANASDKGRDITARLNGKKIARIGEHPEGFATCAYDAEQALALTGITVEALELDHLFNAANQADEQATGKVYEQVSSDLQGLDGVDQQQLDKSLKLKVAHDDLRHSGRYDAFAIR